MRYPGDARCVSRPRLIPTADFFVTDSFRPASAGSRWRLLPFALLLGLALGGCGKSEAPAAAAAPPSVVAEAAKKELVEDQSSYVGRVVAINKVELRARVEGFLKERRFKEGDQVKEGQILFLIEPDQYEAEVEQRLADVESAKASELNASAQLKRGQELLQSNNIAQSKVDELQAAESVAQASIAQAKAALNVAELNLGYTEITAPVTGRVGLANFTVGNLVGPSSGTLATLVSRDPIYVQFPVTQRELLDARKEIEASGGNAKDVKVEVELPDGSTYDHTGHLDFVDVTTDETTDSITLRAKIANPKGILIDGQFVNLRLALGDPKEALMIPQSALQVDQQGVYIFVVDKDNKAQVRRVETGPAKGGDIAITKGLKADELVIVQGIQKVRPGQPVKSSPPTQETDEKTGDQDSDSGSDTSSSSGTDSGTDTGTDSDNDASNTGATASTSNTDDAAQEAKGKARDSSQPASEESEAQPATKATTDNDDQGAPDHKPDHKPDHTADPTQAEQKQNSEANAL